MQALLTIKKIIAVSAIIFSGYQSAFAQQSEIASDCTVTFNISIEDAKADPKAIRSMAGAAKTVYIKGTQIRSDLLTSGYNQSTFINVKSDTIIILREIGTAKYITYLSGDKRREQDKKFEGVVFNDAREKKTILGYECTKVVATLKDGSVYNAFYTPLINLLTNQYEYQFEELPGLVLEYEELLGNGKTKIKYTASKISFLPIPAAKFDVTTTGYRIL